MESMALRLLAIDLPPLVRDLVADALQVRDGEGVFVDLPASGGDVQALAVAARANAVVTVLEERDWPPFCAEMAKTGNGVPVFGLAIDHDGGRFSELRTLETRRTDRGLDLTIADFVETANRAITGEPA
jgi:hypothetical protein